MIRCLASDNCNLRWTSNLQVDLPLIMRPSVAASLRTRTRNPDVNCPFPRHHIICFALALYRSCPSCGGAAGPAVQGLYGGAPERRRLHARELLVTFLGRFELQLPTLKVEFMPIYA